MINDETLELLSAYLDGALPEAERSALEARLSASPELRRELEELRAVSNAVKDLPKEPLPPGFIARLQARRARGEKPRQDWVFLPPAARPLVAAMSIGVVALTIWNKVVVEAPYAVVHPEVAAKIEAAGDAPVSRFDVSARAAGGSSPAMDSLGKSADSASLTVAGPVGEAVRRGDVLPKLEERSNGAPAGAPAAPAAALQALNRPPARAAGRPYGAVGAARGGTADEPVIADRTKTTMTEEERSARNEEMFGFIEKEKKKMGIAKVLPRDGLAAAARGAGLGGGGMGEAPTPPPAISAPAPTLLKKIPREGPAEADAVLKARADSAGRLSPDAGLVFSDARGLASSWVLLGFPGDPPAMDFSSGRLVLIKPSGTKIVSVAADPGAVRVVYRTIYENETSDPSKDRVAPIPAEPKTVLIFDASPR